jgi:hypothetical protein
MGMLLLASAPPVLATGAAGVDLVYIIDQSGSMMGKGQARTIHNDPRAKRIDALYALENRLVESAVDGWSNRLSVIEFGGRNASNPDHRPQLNRKLNRLTIPPLPPGGNDAALHTFIRDRLREVHSVFRGDTDHADALRLATEEIRYYRDHPPPVAAGGNPGPRQALVVLITDGAPYAEGVAFSTLRNEIEMRARTLAQPPLDARLIVFALKDAGSRYWQEWGEFWRRLAARDPQTGAGHAYLLDEPSTVVDDLLAVLGEFIPPVTKAVQSASYAAPAYLQALDFTINFKVPWLPLTDIEIRDPNNQRLAASAITAGGSGYATASVAYPQPGIWRLSPPGARYTVTVNPRYETATLVEPVGPVAQHNRIRIRYRLSGAGPNGLFQEQPGLPPVRFTLQLLSPSGNILVLPLRSDGSGHLLADNVQLSEVGSYQARLEGVTTASDGSPHTIYRSAQASGDILQVSTATAIELRLETPAPDTPITLFNGGTTLPVRFNFYDSRAATMLSPQAVLQPSASLQLGYLQDGNSTAANTVPLQVTAQGLEAQLPVIAAQDRWTYLLQPGQIRLQLGPDNFWQPTYYFTGIAGGQYLLSAPLNVRESWLSLWPLLLVLAVLSGAVWAGWHFLGRALWFAWRDRRYQQEPKLIFKVVRNPTLTKDWSLKGVGRLVPKDNLVQLADGETWPIRRLKIVRLRGRDKEVVIRLSYQPKQVDLPLVTEMLHTRDDSGLDNARRPVQGLEGGPEAVFILLAGSKTP